MAKAMLAESERKPAWSASTTSNQTLLTSASGENAESVSETTGTPRAAAAERSVASLEPVGHDGRKHRLYVVRQHGVAACDIRPRLRGAHQSLAGAGGQSELQVGSLSRARNQSLRIVEQRVGDEHIAHHVLQLDDAIRMQRGWDGVQQVASRAVSQELPFVRGVRIAERHSHEKSVELRLK